jgi:hypothetical protein
MARSYDKITLEQRHIRFAQEYVKDLDPYRAALRAGYMYPGMTVEAVKTVGRSLLKRDSVLELIKIENDRIRSRNDGLVDKIIDEISSIAFFDIRDVYYNDQEKLGQLKSVNDLDERTARAIGSVDTATLPGRTIVTKVKAHDKIKALEMLGKIAGIIRPDVKISLSDSGNKSTDEVTRHTVVFVDNSKKQNDAITDIEPIASESDTEE